MAGLLGTVPHLQFGQGDDVAVVRPVPYGPLARRVVVVKTGGLVVKQLPPLAVRRPLPAKDTKKKIRVSALPD